MPFVSIFAHATLFFPIQEESISCLSFNPTANKNLIQWLPCTVLVSCLSMSLSSVHEWDGESWCRILHSDKWSNTLLISSNTLHKLTFITETHKSWVPNVQCFLGTITIDYFCLVYQIAYQGNKDKNEKKILIIVTTVGLIAEVLVLIVSFYILKTEEKFSR